MRSHRLLEILPLLLKANPERTVIDKQDKGGIDRTSIGGADSQEFLSFGERRKDRRLLDDACASRAGDGPPFADEQTQLV